MLVYVFLEFVFVPSTTIYFYHLRITAYFVSYTLPLRVFITSIGKNLEAVTGVYKVNSQGEAQHDTSVIERRRVCVHIEIQYD